MGAGPTANGRAPSKTHLCWRGLRKKPENKIDRGITEKEAMQVDELMLPVDQVLEHPPLQLPAARIVGVRLRVVRPHGQVDVSSLDALR